jgi:hypothetical protein
MGKVTRIILILLAIAGFIASSHGASIAASSMEEMTADTATLGTDSDLPAGTGARLFTKKSGTVEMVYPGGSSDTGAMGIGAGGTADADSQGISDVKSGGSTGNGSGGMKGASQENSGGGDSGTGR